MNVRKNALAALTGMAVGLGMTVGAMAASRDMPTPYPDKTFHTQNIEIFTEDVAKATGGEDGWGTDNQVTFRRFLI